MKNAILLVVACCAMQVCFGQKIRFTDTSNRWTMLEMDYPDISTSKVEATYSTDTAIKGILYHRLGKNSGSWQFLPLAIREDTLAGVIYCRFITDKFRFDSTDTLEHVLFDYRLKIGDTFKVDYRSYHLRHMVKTLDSVRLGNDYYRRWQMQAVMPGSSSVQLQYGTSPYIFIEGIGTLNTPTFSVSNWLFENNWQLRCFMSKGAQPVCNPAQLLPNLGGVQPVGNMPMIITLFDNLNSCDFKPVSVHRVDAPIEMIVIPNPGGEETVLRLSRPFSGTCTLSNAVGVVVTLESVKGKILIPIGQYSATPGVYYYTLQDAATGQRYTGRFVFAP